MTAKLVYTLDEAAAEARVSVKTLRREIKDGKLRARRLRGGLRILAADLTRYLDGLPVEPSSAPAAHDQGSRKVAPAQTRRGEVVRLFDVFEETAR